MRITLESDYALRILTAMAEYDSVTDAKTISEDTSVTIRFTLKILHKLVQGDLVQSFKGVNGGYKLKAAPKDITLKTVIELIDGPIAIARCLDSAESCSLNCDKRSNGVATHFSMTNTRIAINAKFPTRNSRR